ncbi:zinc transporter ZIP1 isoform X2 [Seriola dumerili]|uniref:Solute carrier family 39 member 1 n=1 Tax=Seriola dumerili TaxID=41447 RepID=A0A3B4UYA2_SERDU|nr:zinc transporter ZIP1 isoform X2 [Seriola dumerili]
MKVSSSTRYRPRHSIGPRVKFVDRVPSAETHRIVLSLISCFAGGVFLAACLLDIIPDYLSDINTELDARKIETSFPLPEFIMAAGFFTVLILEKLVLNCREMGGAQEERAPLIPDNRNGHGHGHGTSPDLESSGHHVHVDFQAHSPFRSFMLFLSLSLHSVFEGLAIGLQDTDSKVLEICIAILVHKSIIVFSLSVKLVQSAVRPLWVAAYIGVFALMSPLGIAIGISVMEAQLEAGALIQAILEGLAAGTFIYITFLEILPHELNSPGKQLLKVLFILLGFSIMAALTFLD